MQVRINLRRATVIRLGALLASFATAHMERHASAAEPEVQTVAEGLRAPNAIAVRSQSTGGGVEVFLAERGVGRVIQFVPGSTETPVDAIVGFTSENSAGADPSPAGVASLTFLDHSRLVVAGSENNKPFMRLYDLAESTLPIKALDHKQDLEI